MTLLEKVKAAIANPDLITDELIWEAMGNCLGGWQYVKCVRRSWTEELHLWRCSGCGKESETWFPRAPDALESGHLTPEYLADWNLVMLEVIKRNINFMQINEARFRFMKTKNRELKICWAAILADMVEKGEVK